MYMYVVLAFLVYTLHDRAYQSLYVEIVFYFYKLFFTSVRYLYLMTEHCYVMNSGFSLGRDTKSYLLNYGWCHCTDIILMCSLGNQIIFQ